jgi:DNA-binding MarR family transcriptional regulator
VAAPRFDETIHPRYRLQICAILAATESIDFATVRETLDISESSLSKHIKYLADAGYVSVTKSRHGSRYRTWLALLPMGRSAYEGHLAAIQQIAALDGLAPTRADHEVLGDG